MRQRIRGVIADDVHVTKLFRDARGHSAHIPDPLRVVHRTPAGRRNVSHEVPASPVSSILSTRLRCTYRISTRSPIEKSERATAAARVGPRPRKWERHGDARYVPRPRIYVNTSSPTPTRITQTINQDVGFGDQIHRVIVARLPASRVLAVGKQYQRLSTIDAAKLAVNCFVYRVVHAGSGSDAGPSNRRLELPPVVGKVAQIMYPAIERNDH